MKAIIGKFYSTYCRLVSSHKRKMPFSIPMLLQLIFLNYLLLIRHTVRDFLSLKPSSHPSPQVRYDSRQLNTEIWCTVHENKLNWFLLTLSSSIPSVKYDPNLNAVQLHTLIRISPTPQ